MIEIDVITGARDPGSSHAIDVAASEPGNFPQSFRRRVGGGDQDRIETGIAGGSDERLGLENGDVGDEEAVRARFHRSTAEGVAAARHHEVGVSQDSHRDLGVAPAEFRQQRKGIRRTDVLLESALRRRLDHWPVRNRIRERDPHFDHVGATFHGGVEQPAAGLQIRVAEHQKGTERALARSGEAVEHDGVTAHDLSRSRRWAWAMSLSPRPDRPTTRIVPSSASAASFSA